jgi:hypothetical protein
MRPVLVSAIALGASACDQLFGLDPLRPPDAAIQPGDLMLAYAFEDPAGSSGVGDASGNGNTAQLFGPAFEMGRYGRGLTFDGVDDHAVASNSPSIDIGGTGLTLAAWIRVDVAAASADGVIVGKLWAPLGTFADPYYQYGLEYDLESNSIALLLTDTSGVGHAPFTLGGVSGSFQHVAFSYDGTTVRGYLDGVELFTAPAQGEIPTRDTQLVMGVDGNRSQPFSGQLDNLRIYRRALDADEIAADRSR